MSLPSEIIATELASLPERKQGFVLQALLITLWHREAALVLLDLLGNPAELDHDQTKISAIHKVSESEAEGLFDILVEKEANINYSRDRNEPDFLTVAIQYGHLSMAKGLGDCKGVSRLLDLGADIDNVSGSYGTPMTTAASTGKLEVGNLLVERRADVTKKNQTTQGNHQSAIDSSGIEPNITRLLLVGGADANGEPRTSRSEEYTTTPLQIAVSHGTSEIAQLLLLLEYGADVKLCNTGFTPIQLAVQRTTIACHRSHVAFAGGRKQFRSMLRAKTARE
ncbi:uncharacterized protein RCO7_09929 [Rhynchosporium graminicola]|uniref:Uncharacterized protein n=1 Tax=Rhynchosporium graminicola TaxID=2792576 RepID=A0A1E1LL77_9HELO|nr:uncharacterized protein RCO7_09929 [Rhynchosporium commune]